MKSIKILEENIYIYQRTNPLSTIVSNEEARTFKRKLLVSTYKDVATLTCRISTMSFLFFFFFLTNSMFYYKF